MHCFYFSRVPPPKPISLLSVFHIVGFPQIVGNPWLSVVTQKQGNKTLIGPSMHWWILSTYDLLGLRISHLLSNIQCGSLPLDHTISLEKIPLIFCLRENVVVVMVV